MWNLPGGGIKPVSPALAGGFLTTEAPGKSRVGVNNPRVWMKRASPGEAETDEGLWDALGKVHRECPGS